MTGRFSIPLPVWGSLIGSLLLRIASAASATLTALILAGPHLPSVSGDVNLAGLITLGSASLLSLFTGAFYLAELSTAPIFGVLSDRSGRRRFMEIGVACGAVAITLLIVGVSLESTVKVPAAVTILILLAIFFLKGFSTASSAPATLGYIAETSIEDVGLRGRIVGVYEIATAGGLLGGAVLGAKLWDRFGPDALFASLASYLLAAVAFSMVREVSNRSGSGHGIAESLAVLKNVHLLRFAPAWLAVNAVLGLWLTHAVLQAAEDDATGQLLAGGFTGGQIGNGMALFGLVFGAGMFFWSLQLGKIKKTTIMLIATGAGVIEGVFLFALNHSPGNAALQIIALATVVGASVFVLAGFTPAALAYLADISDENPIHRGPVMGAYSMLLGVGQLVGAGIGGPLADRWHMDGLIFGTVALMLVAGVTVLALRRYDHRAEAVTRARAGTPA